MIVTVNFGDNSFAMPDGSVLEGLSQRVVGVETPDKE